MQPIIILGTGLAGFNLLKEIRKSDAEVDILMITADDGKIYSKPMLSAGFGKNKSPDDLVMATPEELESQYNIKVLTQTNVEHIDNQAKLIRTENDTFEYSKLVLALGADTFKLPLAGDGIDGVYSVNDLIDYRKFRDALAVDSVKHVAIIGGGLIGCEFANDLANGGFTTTIIEPQGRLMPLLIPETTSEVLQTGLAELGTEFVYGHFAKAVNKVDSGYQVVLDNGKAIEADLVVSAVGLRPRVALAKSTGLETNRGIVVNRLQQTSDEHIYALGDCVEIENLVLPYVMPIMASARALAKTLTGTETSVSYGVMPVSVKTPACPLVVNTPNPAEPGDWHSEAEGLNSKSVFINEGEKLGYALTGDFVKEKMALNKEMPAILK